MRAASSKIIRVHRRRNGSPLPAGWPKSLLKRMLILRGLDEMSDEGVTASGTQWHETRKETAAVMEMIAQLKAMPDIAAELARHDV